MAVASGVPVSGWEVRNSPLVGSDGLMVVADSEGRFSVTALGDMSKKEAAALLRVLALEVEESE